MGDYSKVHGVTWTKGLWFITATLFFSDSKAAPETVKKQALPMWCHGLLTSCLTAHTRCIFARRLLQLVLNQYPWHMVLRIRLSLSSLTSCKRAHTPQLTDCTKHHQSPPPCFFPDPSLLPASSTLMKTICEHVPMCHIQKKMLFHLQLFCI